MKPKRKLYKKTKTAYKCHKYCQIQCYFTVIIIISLLIVYLLGILVAIIYNNDKICKFQGFYSDLTVNICCVAESVRLQQMLANYGIQSQTPHQIEPIEIWPPGELVKAYGYLGFNNKLKLTGYKALFLVSFYKLRIFQKFQFLISNFSLTVDEKRKGLDLTYNCYQSLFIELILST